MSISKNEHIVYNGPIPNLFSWKECKSMGEVILKRLKELSDSVLLVSNFFLDHEFKTFFIKLFFHYPIPCNLLSIFHSQVQNLAPQLSLHL